MEGIGKAIREKVGEFLKTGSVKKFEGKIDSKKNIAIETLSEVWGVGPTMARKLYSKGITTIDKLRKNEKLLGNL